VPLRSRLRLAVERVASETPGVMSSEVRYARSGAVNIAYQVVGDGPLDLLYVPGWISHLDLYWEEPAVARFLRRLGADVSSQDRSFRSRRSKPRRGSRGSRASGGCIRS
jgi:hypothetical protein